MATLIFHIKTSNIQFFFCLIYWPEITQLVTDITLNPNSSRTKHINIFFRKRLLCGQLFLGPFWELHTIWSWNTTGNLLFVFFLHKLVSHLHRRYFMWKYWLSDDWLRKIQLLNLSWINLPRANSNIHMHTWSLWKIMSKRKTIGFDVNLFTILLMERAILLWESIFYTYWNQQ